MTTVISFINYKGGVGKTTSAYHVSCSLAQHHRQRVLMIDIDPQTNLTFLCATPEQWDRRKRNVGTIKTLYDRYNQALPLEVQRYIWNGCVVVGRNPIPGLDMIPCDIELLGEDLGGSGQIVGTFPTMQAIRQNAQQYLKERSFLSKVIDGVRDTYDWIVIDCPPNLYFMTQNALHASDYYVVTAIPDHLSTIGLHILVDKIGKIGKLISAAQTWAGSNEKRAVAELGAIAFVKIRSGGSRVVTTHHDIMNKAKSEFLEDKVVSTYTTELIGYSEAAESRVPVWEHGSTSARTAARYNAYPRITRELITKLREVP